jgi:hypothetical protein
VVHVLWHCLFLENSNNSLMKRLLLFFLPCLASAVPALTNLTFDHITYSSWQMHLNSSEGYDALRMLYSIPPVACANPATAGVTTEQNIAGGGGAGLLRMDTSGKTPNTLYNVCPQVLQAGVWYGTITKQVRTAPALAVGYTFPPHAAMVNTAYPAEIVSGANTDTYTVPTSTGCATFHACMNTAVANVLTRNAIINLPVGQANTILGPQYIDQTWPDEVFIPNTQVNASDGSITRTSHGWLDNQAVVLARTSDANVPNGVVFTDFVGNDGRLYYVKRKDANSFWLYDAPLTKGGKKLNLSPNGSLNFHMAAYPRQIKNIVVRTATPDSQIAAPGTALGGMQWNAKLAWFTNTTANRCKGCAALMTFGKAGDTFFQSLAANMTFVGLALTVQDDAVSIGEVDPNPWDLLIGFGVTTQNIIFDRCSLFLPSNGQRSYTVLNLAGINNAFVNNWMDSSLHAFHGMDFGMTLSTPTSTSIRIGANSGALKIAAGQFSTSFPSDVTITFSGTPNFGATRVAVGLPMSSSNVIQVFKPTNVTGSCSGGGGTTCAFITRDTSTLQGCDTASGNRGQWSVDGAGEVNVRLVGCWNMAGDGTIGAPTYPFTDFSDKGFCCGGVEGTQMIQGSYGPGPITFRNNDLFLTGNTMHFADDGGYYSRKSDIWIYRNRFRAFWPGMWGAAGMDGNDYGNRNHAIETKGYANMTIEGNLFGGNYNDKSQAAGSEVIFLRATDQGGLPGGSNGLITDNLFEHVAGGVQPGDLLHNESPQIGTGNPVFPTFGPTAVNSAIINNVWLDVNQLGPDNGCIKSSGCLPAGTGSYSAPSFPDVGAGSGWFANGPQVTEGFLLMNNTMPDMRGWIPVLFYGSNFKNGGLGLVNNIFSVRADASAFGLGARVGDNGYPPGCSGAGHALLVCLWPNATISGNVILSQTASQATINADGWGTGNIVPATPSNLTAIFPAYNLNPTNASPAWTGDIDPESVRIPAGSTYQGKGADITRLKRVMGYVDSPGALFDASNNLVVTWLAPDTQACAIDYGTGSLFGTFGRSLLDAGGGRYRKVTVPAVNFTANTTYNVRIACERFQPVVTARSN